MKTARFFVMVLVLGLLMTLGSDAGAQEPQLLSNGGCPPGNDYDPLCDVTRDGAINVLDVERVAARWRTEGLYTQEAYWSLAGNAGTTPGTHFLGTTDGQALIINPNGGNVGIGTDSPQEMLVVDGGNSTARIAIDSTSPTANAGIRLRQDGTSRWSVATVGTDGDFQIYEDDAGVNRLFIKGAGPGQGNVGIGTSSPRSGIDLVGSSGWPSSFLYLDATGGGGHVDSGIRLYSNGDVKGHLWYSSASDQIYFKHDKAASQLTLDPSGNVGIGELDPAVRLHVDTGTDNTIVAWLDGRHPEGAALVLNGGNAGNVQMALSRESSTWDWWMGRAADDDRYFIQRVTEPNIIEDFFAISTNGYVGINTAVPVHRLDVKDAINGDPTPGIEGPHVARIENTSTSPHADVLLLQVGRTDHPGDRNNFISFANGNNTEVGAIEGNGAGGVTYKSGSADFAEFLPRFRADEVIQAGDIVGDFGGKIAKNTQGADRVLVISSSPIVLGNAPGEKEEHLYEIVAFLGQVPVKVRGAVRAGDYIVPSGSNDGTGVAVSPQELTAVPFPLPQIVGIAWESSDVEGVKLINTAVGPNLSDAWIGTVIKTLHKQILALKQQNTELEARLVALEQIADDLSQASSVGQHPSE